MSDHIVFSGSKSSSSGFKQTPDNLRSNDTFEGIMGVAIGPLKGPTRGLKSIKLDGTAIENETGELNFGDFVCLIGDGDPTKYPQTVQLKLGAGASPQNVNLTLGNTNSSGPGPWITKTLTNTNADFIDLRFIVNQLYHQDKNGVYSNTATIEIQMKPTGLTNWIAPEMGTVTGTYNEQGINFSTAWGTLIKGLFPQQYYDAGGNFINPSSPGYSITGKTTSASVYELRIAVPNTGAYANKQWDVRCRLVQPESVDADPNFDKRNISWESLAAVYANNMGNDPDWKGVAWMQLYGKASDQLSGVPEVTGEWDAKIVSVPPSTVFNPDTRVYTGAIWDGSWAKAWTNDPAWIINDAISDSLSGLSLIAPGSYLNKWDALEMSKYCSALVPDGAGGQEPRFSINIAVTEQQKAEDFIRYLAGAVGALAWDTGDGEWRIKMDKPSNAVDIFTLEDIENEFVYSSTDVDTRYNDITFKFKNKEFDYRDDAVRLYDNTSIATIGRKPTTIVGVGCTGRQEAMRRTMLRLLTSVHETRMVTFTTNRRGRNVEPLDCILIADGDLTTNGVRTTGRAVTVAADRKSITLRDTVRLEVGVTYTMNYASPNPNYTPNTTTQPTNDDWKKPTLTGTVNVINTSGQRGDVRTLYFDTALPADIPANLDIALSATGLPTIPKMYRVVDVTPNDDGERVSISAIEVYTAKYALADNVSNQDTVYQDLRGVVPPPTAPDGGPFLSVVSVPAEQGSNTNVAANWVRPAGAFISGFRVRHSVNGGAWITDIERTQDSSFELVNPGTGNYAFEVCTIDRRGNYSTPLTGNIDLTQALIDAAQVYYVDPVSGDPTVPINDLQPAEPGADVTGNNTANDTANVGGVPSGTVLANIAAAANDTVAPGVPTGLAVSSNLTNDPVTGQPIITLVATCTASVAPDIGSYQFAVQQGAGSFIEYTVISPRLELKVPANTAFNVKVRATDKSGNPSGYSSTVPHTTIKDTTAPAVPTGFTITAGYTSLWLNWTNDSAVDLDAVEIWENTTNNSATATKIATVEAAPGAPGAYARTGLTTSGQRFYWLKSVDTSLNTSGFSSGANGTPGFVATTDLSGFITADQVATGFGGAGPNLVMNGNADSGTSAGWKLGAFTSAGSTFAAVSGQGVNGSYAFAAAKTATGNQSSGRMRAIPVKQSTPYNIKVQAKGSSATTNGFYIRVYFFSAVDAQGYGTTAVGSTIDLTGASNGPLTTSYVPYDQVITTPAGAQYMAVEIINYTTSTALTVYFDEFAVLEQLSANQIGTGFITSGMVAAGAIDITKFATGLAPVEKVSSKPSTGNFEGRQIYLTTDKKVYRWTDTSTTGTSFWSVQTDGADIAANSISAGKFVAGAIQAADIAAQQIMANHLLIGDAFNQIRDPEFRSVGPSGNVFWVQGSGGTTPPALTINTTDTDVTTTLGIARALKWDYAGATTNSYAGLTTPPQNYIPVQPGQAYRFTCPVLIKAGWNGRLIATLQWYTATKAYTGVTDQVQYGIYTNSPAPADVILAGTVTAASGKGYLVAPSNAAYLLITLQPVNLSTVPAGVAYMANPFLNRMADGQLVVDGSITATAIAANTITAQNLVLATRGITVSGIEFTHNSGGTSNLLGWTAGSISYVDNSGTVQTVSISAGSQAYTSGTLYIYWTQGATSLTATTTASTALNSNVALMATYLGGTNLIATYGRTIIDGSKIYANSIGAAQLSVGSITTTQLAVGQFGGNLVGNPGGESGTTDGWLVDPSYNSAGSTFSATNADKNSGAYSFLLSKTASGNSIGIDNRAMPVVPGRTYSVRWSEKGATATSSGWYLRIHERTSAPTSGYVSAGVATSFTDLISNGAITASWNPREFTYTVPAGVYWVSITPLNYTGGPLSVWVDDFQFIEQNTTTMIADGAITTNKITVGTLNGDRITAGTLSAATLTAGTALAGSITVSGTALSTTTTSAANGQTAFTGTAKYRTAGAPTNNPVPSAITITDNTNGTRDIQVNWNAYVQGTNQADFLMLFWNKTSSAPTINDASVSFSVNTTGGSYYRFEGVNPAQAYSFGIAAVRRTENGLEIGTIVSPTSSPQWVNVASGTPNFTANIGGTAAATVVSNAALGAQDPGTRINAAATLINPGKILISGASTLASWQNGGDNTKIEGGAIAANTITANKLTIGNRNVNVIDITFSTNGTTLSWTSGYVGYTNDAGTQVQASVSAGSTSLTGYVWVYWTQGATTLSATNTNPFSGSFSQDNAVTFCTWQSGQKWFVANYGTTIIDGSRITAASIAADRLVANSITSAQIAANTITADRMNVTSLSAITANLGAITAGSLNINGKFIVASDGTTTIQSATSGARLVLSGSTVEVYDASNVRRVRLGIW